MAEPRNKSLLVWEPFPYILLIALIILAGSIDPNGAAIPFWIAAAFAAAATVFFIIAFASYGRRSRLNPDPAGNLTRLQGIERLTAGHSDVDGAPVVTVADARRHQQAIEIVRTRGGENATAILIPRASRWLSRRYRVGVQLIGGGEVRHAGFLPDFADERWRDELGALRDSGIFAEVPARIRGSAQPFSVDLDVSGLAEALERHRPGAVA